MTDEQPRLTSADIQSAIEVILGHSEPIRDRLYFVIRCGYENLGIEPGYILRLERREDGLWHEMKQEPQGNLSEVFNNWKKERSNVNEEGA